MKRNLSFVLALPLLCLPVTAGEAVTAVQGTVKKVDSGARTVVVKTADGTEHTVHVAKKTAVVGSSDTAAGAKDAMHGLKEGSDVVVHYTTKGTEKTAQEIDVVGKGGLKASEGTISRIDRGAKTMTVKAADGTEQTYKLASHAAKDAGKDVAEGAEKSGKVTVYYTEEAGQKVAHFFKKTF